MKNLRHSDYDAAGGVIGALAKHAERVLRQQANPEVAMRGLCRLVQIAAGDEEGADSRRRVRLDELDPAERDALSAFVEARLLTTDTAPGGHGETIELAHEALIRTWPPLHDRIAKHREFLLWRQWLAPLLDRWITAHRSDDYLLSGELLKEAAARLAERRQDFGRVEVDFIEAALRNESGSRRRRMYGLAAFVITPALLMLFWFIASKTARYQVWAATEDARSLLASSDQSGVLRWFEVLTLVGRASEASKWADGIDNQTMRGYALGGMARGRVRQHSARDVRALLKGISDKDCRRQAVRVAMLAFAEAGDSAAVIDAAVIDAADLFDEHDKDGLKEEAGSALALKDAKGALAIADRISDPASRQRATEYIVMIASDRPGGPKEVGPELLSRYPSANRTINDMNSVSVTELVDALVIDGDFPIAENVARRFKLDGQFEAALERWGDLNSLLSFRTPEADRALLRRLAIQHDVSEVRRVLGRLSGKTWDISRLTGSKDTVASAVAGATFESSLSRGLNMLLVLDEVVAKGWNKEARKIASGSEPSRIWLYRSLLDKGQTTEADRVFSLDEVSILAQAHRADQLTHLLSMSPGVLSNQRGAILLALFEMGDRNTALAQLKTMPSYEASEIKLRIIDRLIGSENIVGLTSELYQDDDNGHDAAILMLLYELRREGRTAEALKASWLLKSSGAFLLAYEYCLRANGILTAGTLVSQRGDLKVGSEKEELALAAEAGALIRAGDRAGASVALEKALDAVHLVVDPYQQTETLITLSELLAEMGLYGKARETANRARTDRRIEADAEIVAQSALGDHPALQEIVRRNDAIESNLRQELSFTLFQARHVDQVPE